MNPRKIPCRMCQARPGDLCSFKGAVIASRSILGGHDARTPDSYRCFHYKRVLDARQIGSAS